MYSLGRVTAVSGAQMTVEADQPLANSVRIGAMIKTRSVDHEVVGTIGALQVDGGSPPRSIFCRRPAGRNRRLGRGSKRIPTRGFELSDLGCPRSRGERCRS